MNIKRSAAGITSLCGALFALAACQTTAPSVPLTLSAAPCTPPPVDRCVRGEDCGALVVEQGPAMNPETERNYYLDYSCDLREGDPVTIVLNLHGGGSYGNWQRHYFPILDHIDDYNLIVATPNSPIQFWRETDDAHLEGIVTNLIDEIGAENINSFWMAGHSQGGMTSRRLICTDFYADKVDGFLSLSGGRVSRSQLSPNFYRPGPDDTGPRPPREPRVLPPEEFPICEFSHINTNGELEIVELPDTSEWADRLGCDARIREDDVIDTEPGYVYDGSAQRVPNPVWGLLPRGGTSEVFVYPNCDGGRIVADVIRLDKGHTEGLEPEVTRTIVELMMSAEGGKIASSAQ
ncbi:alpha/beta fold hydrolase [Ponticaulis koreensis]|uniref:alpha/beta fold hydrolase n=1 Tax=Ponticaulis koreensis TaxID=1123045 RepID=UPI0012DE8B73|nr:alpha/beta hydrolase [Ponticaulis koreensis]